MPTETIAKTYRVASVSENVGAFGHRGIILIARDGEAWEICVSTSLGVRQLAKGEFIKLPLNSAGIQQNASYGSVDGVAFECPRRLPNAPRPVVAEVWKD